MKQTSLFVDMKSLLILWLVWLLPLFGCSQTTLPLSSPSKYDSPTEIRTSNQLNSQSVELQTTSSFQKGLVPRTPEIATIESLIVTVR